MTDNEYRASMDALASHVRVICMLPLDDLLRTVERAEAVGCFLVSPAEYQRGAKQLSYQGRLLRLAIEMRAVVEEIREGAG